jgi:hypothetical protein
MMRSLEKDNKMKKKMRGYPLLLILFALFSLLGEPLTAATSENKPLAHIPFELHKGLVFIDVEVNGKPLNLLVDSAAGHPALDLQKALAIGLNVDKKGLQSGVHTANSQEVSIAENVTFKIGKAEVTEPFAVVYSFEFLSKIIKHPVDGVVGGALFRQYVVTINYPKLELVVFHPNMFDYSGSGKIVPLEATSSDLLVKGKVLPALGKKEIEGQFSLDTGATEADFVLWNAGEEIEKATKNLQQVRSTSFGGSGAALQGTLEEFRLGDLIIPHPSVRFTKVVDHPSAYSRGNIGSNLFQRFKVIFDAPHSKLILE